MRADFDNAGSQQGLLRRCRASVASSSKQNCLTKIKKLKKGYTAVTQKKTPLQQCDYFFFHLLVCLDMATTTSFEFLHFF